MSRLALALVLALAGCGVGDAGSAGPDAVAMPDLPAPAPPDEPPPSEEAEAASPIKVSTAAEDDPDERITDVQHLLGEAAALHAATRRTKAQATWQVAYDLFREHLLPSLRALDAEQALQAEYTFGRLRRALEARRGRPKPLARELEDLLETHRTDLVVALTPAQEAPEGPVEPPPP